MQDKFSALWREPQSAGSTAIKERKSPIPVVVRRICLICLAGTSLFGCGTKTEMSKQEQDNFKGGPPPPGYLAEAEKRKAAAEKRMPQSFKVWQDQRNAALASHGAAPVNSPPADTSTQ